MQKPPFIVYIFDLQIYKLKIQRMVEKIFQKLKQAYSSLGLGDALLMSHASSLGALGFVTDENIDSVVSSQKAFLEDLQKANDKRVNDAMAKSKQEAETARLALEKKIKELEDKGGVKADEDNELLKKINELAQRLDTLNGENEKMKAEQAKRERQQFIVKKAQELGIPEWRTNEGFNVGESASESDITTYLSSVANNIRENMTSGDKLAVPKLDEKGNIPEEAIKSMAANLVRKSK